MDPVTAFLNAVAAFCSMVEEIEKGQPLESRAKAWERWDKFLDTIDRLFGGKK